MAAGKVKYYAVKHGRTPGIYDTWFGPGGAEEQVRGWTGARYKSFASRAEAAAWLDNNRGAGTYSPLKKHPPETGADSSSGNVIMYTDGSCRGNPGPGGYGAVIMSGGKRKEIDGGFRLTTNNRMELTACIAALETLKKPERVVLHSDSSYVVNGINKGWAKKWRANNWMRTPSEQAANTDLWERLLRLCERHHVTFVWVRGHAGDPENTRCDEMALRAASGENLAVDAGFENESG
ncbi:MAG TPA: ribonuclease HI [Deltaproteobacteria bacterium]|nr:ribonuclease HI [Deltaproteobacteria bacterium]